MEALALADFLNRRPHHEDHGGDGHHHAAGPVPEDAEILSVLEAREALAVQRVIPPADDRGAAFRVRLKRARGGVWHTTASDGWYEQKYSSGVPPWVPSLALTAEDRALLGAKGDGDGDPKSVCR